MAKPPYGRGTIYTIARSGRSRKGVVREMETETDPAGADWALTLTVGLTRALLVVGLREKREGYGPGPIVLTGREILPDDTVDRNAQRTVLAHALAHLQSVAALPRMIEEAVWQEREENTTPDERMSIPWVHVFNVTLEIAGVERVAILRIKEARDGRFYYDHRLVRIEPAAPHASARRGTNPLGSAQDAAGSTDRNVADPPRSVNGGAPPGSCGRP
jgi:hypothetical protein